MSGEGEDGQGVEEEIETALFAVTKRVREAISLVNSLDESKLAVAVRRLARAVGEKGGSSAAFSEEEMGQLQEHMKLSASELSTVLEACSYILERAAYSLVRSEDLSAQLQAAGMLQEHARAFAGVWEAEAKGVLGKLRSASLGGTPRLKATEWELHVQAARSDMGKLAEPRAIFQMQLEGGQPGEGGDDVTVEFSQAELASFLGKLDQMQAQLDQLS